MMMGKATWASTLVLAVLTRLLITDAGPLQHKKQRSFTIEEMVEDPEREIDGTYSKLIKKRSHGLVEPLGGIVTAAADGGSGQEPKYHFEVHTVQHKMGHLMSADQKLQAVIRHSAGLNELVNNSNASPNSNKNESKVGDKNSAEPPPDNSVASLELENEQKKSDDTDEALNPRHASSNSETRDVDETPPVALARQDPRSDGSSSVAGVHSASSIADVYFLAVVAGCSVAGIAGLLLAAVCWYRLHKKIKAASEVDYPAYGVTGPSADTSASGKDSRGAGSPGDRKLAQSAQMYHYQHQKQQMIASERLASDTHPAAAGSDVESDEENEEGDYTVFECPGLATNGEMEVRNPLFNDQTPSSTIADSSQSARK